MTPETKRDRIIALVHQKDALATELNQLRERERAVDAELDALIGGHSAPVAASAPPSAPAAQPKAKKATRAKAKKKAKAKVQPTAPNAEPTPTAKAKPAAKPKAAPPKPKAGAKPTTEGPTIKEKIIAALQESPAGLDVAAVAQRAYGSTGKDALRMCQANLYNLQRQMLVTHEGPIWRSTGGA